jgi:hypothetical protein
MCPNSDDITGPSANPDDRRLRKGPQFDGYHEAAGLSFKRGHDLVLCASRRSGLANTLEACVMHPKNGEPVWIPLFASTS